MTDDPEVQLGSQIIDRLSKPEPEAMGAEDARAAIDARSQVMQMIEAVVMLLPERARSFVPLTDGRIQKRTAAAEGPPILMVGGYAPPTVSALLRGLCQSRPETRVRFLLVILTYPVIHLPI